VGLGLFRPAPLRAEEIRAYRPGARDGGRLEYHDGIPVLILEGGPEQMGRQQAALVGGQIRPLLGLPRVILEGRRTGGVWTAAGKTAWTVLGHAADRHRQELDGLAAALGATPEEKTSLAVGNVLAELRRFERCSALIVEPQRSRTGGPLFGRNYDFATFGVLDGLSLVTVYRPTGYHAFAAVGYPGSMGVLSGMNDAGLAAACLDSGPARDDSPRFDPRGAPMLLTFRRVLEECAVVEEAEKLLRRSRHTTWFNLAVCDRKRAAVFEITAKQVVTRRPEDHGIACTNHFRTPELGVPAASERYAKLAEHLKQPEPFTWSDVARAMHDARMRDRTIQTMVFEPDPLILRLSIFSRPASAGPFTALGLKEFFRQP
jgi:hypothetical protein